MDKTCEKLRSFKNNNNYKYEEIVVSNQRKIVKCFWICDEERNLGKFNTHNTQNKQGKH